MNVESGFLRIKIQIATYSVIALALACTAVPAPSSKPAIPTKSAEDSALKEHSRSPAKDSIDEQTQELEKKIDSLQSEESHGSPIKLGMTNFECIELDL